MVELPQGIVAAGSVTLPTDAWRGSVLIAGSHGGVYAAYCACKAGVRGVILNDAGRGKDDAGIGGASYCDDLGIAYAAVDTMSARIGNGDDMAARGVISSINRVASSLGVKTGMAAIDAALLMRNAEPEGKTVPIYEEAREVFAPGGSGRRIVLIDSASLVKPEDTGQIVITGSHGGLPNPDPFSAMKVDAFAAFFHDAGVGADGAGITRLPNLDTRGIIGGTVAAASARIGDARSVYRDGVLSHLNEAGIAAGGEIGMHLEAFTSKLVS
jgi:hypothetical protein